MEVRQLDIENSVIVKADGWDRLVLAPSGRGTFLSALEAAGLELHRRPSWPGRIIAVRPGETPVWER
jgi:hypothetical protein